MGSAWSYFKGQGLRNHQSVCEGRECSAELAMLRPPEGAPSLLGARGGVWHREERAHVRRGQATTGPARLKRSREDRSLLTVTPVRALGSGSLRDQEPPPKAA